MLSLSLVTFGKVANNYITIQRYVCELELIAQYNSKDGWLQLMQKL